MSRTTVLGSAWLLLGLTALAWAAWSAHVIDFWTSGLAIALALQCLAGALAIATGGAVLRRARSSARLLRIVSGVTLAYSAIWLFFGGVDDAPHYAIPLVVIALLALYGFRIPHTLPAAEARSPSAGR